MKIKIINKINYDSDFCSGRDHNAFILRVPPIWGQNYCTGTTNDNQLHPISRWNRVQVLLDHLLGYLIALVDNRREERSTNWSFRSERAIATEQYRRLLVRNPFFGDFFLPSVSESPLRDPKCCWLLHWSSHEIMLAALKCIFIHHWQKLRSSGCCVSWTANLLNLQKKKIHFVYALESIDMNLHFSKHK